MDEPTRLTQGGHKPIVGSQKSIIIADQPSKKATRHAASRLGHAGFGYALDEMLATEQVNTMA